MQNTSLLPTRIAILVFFLIAIIGWINNLSPATCTTRALICAIAIYYICKIAIKLITGIIVNHILDSKLKEMMQKQQQKADAE